MKLNATYRLVNDHQILKQKTEAHRFGSFEVEHANMMSEHHIWQNVRKGAHKMLPVKFSWSGMSHTSFCMRPKSLSAWVPRDPAIDWEKKIMKPRRHWKTLRHWLGAGMMPKESIPNETHEDRCVPGKNQRKADSEITVTLKPLSNACSRIDPQADNWSWVEQKLECIECQKNLFQSLCPQGGAFDRWEIPSKANCLSERILKQCFCPESPLQMVRYKSDISEYPM